MRRRSSSPLSAFSVDPRVLIPRPDTEVLVDLVLDAIRARLAGAPRPPGTPPLRLWDVATGSGAIPVAVAVGLRRIRALEHLALVMSDISPDALAVALENAVAHGVADRLEPAVGDLFRIYLHVGAEEAGFHWVTMPDGVEVRGNEIFDPAKMSELFSLGYEMARNGPRWQTKPPGYERVLGATR